MKKTTIMRNVKWVAVLTTLLELGCHQPLKKQPELVDRDDFKVETDGLAWMLGDQVPPPLRERRERGLCLRCGYDLRGSKDICPECGIEFETATNA